MGRNPSPWYRKSHKAWVCRIDGSQQTLAKGPKAETRAAALETFHRLMAERRKAGAASDLMGVKKLCDLFLAHVDADRKPATFQWYRYILQSFCDTCGHLAAAEVRPHHITAWLGAGTWGRGTRRRAIGAVKATFAWGRREGHLDAHPLAELEKPPPVRREKVLSREQAARTIASVNEPFARLLEFLNETGARPGEAARATAADVDWTRGLLVLQEHKTDGSTGRPRTVLLSARAREILAALAQQHPEGPLFRNSRGHAWTRNAIVKGMIRARERLGMGKEATAHALRHRFATDALASLPNAVVAALLGHTGTAMVDQFYSHVADEIDVLRAAIDRVRPGPEEPDS
jgi:integrase